MGKKYSEKLKEMKPRLERGMQREIARLTRIHPQTVSLAFDGFLADEKKNEKIFVAASSLILHRT